jgi:uncharacterized protein YjbJ (UPF0337 family)
MNLIKLSADWNQVKGKMRHKLTAITSQELLPSKGKRDELLGRWKVTLGKTKVGLEKFIMEL